jgi:hypothetical protein
MRSLAEILSRSATEIKQQWRGGPLRVFAVGNPEPGLYLCTGCRREGREALHLLRGHGWACTDCRERLIRSSLAQSGRFRNRAEQFAGSEF